MALIGLPLLAWLLVTGVVVIFFNLIMQLVHGFQEFNGPYMVTEGGPLHSTYLLSLYIYEECFKYFNLGYGAALSWVMFALIGKTEGDIVQVVTPVGARELEIVKVHYI